MKHINMLYTVDKKYFPIMLVSIYSLLEHNPNIEFDIHIIAEGLTPEDLSLLEQTIHCFKNARHQLYDFEPIKKLIEKYNMPRWRNSAMANARLFFDSYIDASENLLYVDSDTIIRKSLEGLFDYTGAVNMVRDPMVPRKHWKSLDPDMKTYYNSGFIWVNLPKWHENGCQDKIFEELEKKSDYEYPDQDILNKSLKDIINQLPLKYNVFSILEYFPVFIILKFFYDRGINDQSLSELIDARNNPIVDHCTPVSSWRGWFENTLHPCRESYAGYFAKIGISPMRDENVDKVPNEIIHKCIQCAKILCPQIIKKPVKKLILARNDWLESLKRNNQ